MVTTEPVMTSSEWLSGANTPAKKVSLKPKDMKLCKYCGSTNVFGVSFFMVFMGLLNHEI